MLTPKVKQKTMKLIDATWQVSKATIPTWSSYTLINESNLWKLPNVCRIQSKHACLECLKFPETKMCVWKSHLKLDLFMGTHVFFLTGWFALCKKAPFYLIPMSSLLESQLQYGDLNLLIIYWNHIEANGLCHVWAMYPLPIQAFAPQTLCDHLGFLGIMARATCHKKDPRPSNSVRLNLGGDSLINLFPMLREQQTPNTTPQDFFPYSPEISHHCSGSCLFQITVFSIYMRFPNLSPADSLAKKTHQGLDFRVSPCFFVQLICHGFFELKKRTAGVAQIVRDGRPSFWRPQRVVETRVVPPTSLSIAATTPHGWIPGSKI